MYFRTILFVLLSGALARADFKYDQTTRMTGGSMLRMMQMVGRGATEPHTSTVAVKGDKMATRSKDSIVIIDLAAETTTTVDLKDQTYSVMTFAQTREQMEKVFSKGGGKTDTNISVEGKQTGKTATVNGLPTSELFLTMLVEGNSGGQRGQMRMEMSNWVSASKIAGFDEVTAFQRKMVQKMGLATLAGPAGPMAQPGMAKGMAEMAKKMAETGGVPIVTVIRMIPTDPEQIKQMEAMQAQNADAPGRPSMGEALSGALGGRFGGFGRKKKTEEAPAAAPAPAAAAPAKSTLPVEGSFSSAASMMEMLTESANFSSLPVDAALFAVPTGFKQVKPKGL
ncbi:MAG: hypothetical protein INH43_07290 [Acidobacteriaceae bacterium]|nr:hypothetical protein [Acidobacteriaceae bacterium]